MRDFLSALFDSGKVSVPAGGVEFNPVEACDDLLLDFDRAGRLILAGEPPLLQIDVARWAATLLAETCRLTIWREAGTDEVDRVFSTQCPAPHCAETDYSADLFFQYLPQLAQFVHRLAAGDPLLERVQTFASEWMLSSVGMDLASFGSVAPFIHHPSLRRLYVDRILLARDTRRLADPETVVAVREALGAHEGLAPEIVHAIGKREEQRLEYTP